MADKQTTSHNILQNQVNDRTSEATRRFQDVAAQYHANKPGPLPESEDEDQILLDAMREAIKGIEPPKELKEELLEIGLAARNPKSDI